MHDNIADLQNEVAEVKSNLQNEVAEVKSDLQNEVAQVKQFVNYQKLACPPETQDDPHYKEVGNQCFYYENKTLSHIQAQENCKDKFKFLSQKSRLFRISNLLSQECFVCSISATNPNGLQLSHPRTQQPAIYTGLVGCLMS